MTARLENYTCKVTLRQLTNLTFLWGMKNNPVHIIPATSISCELLDEHLPTYDGWSWFRTPLPITKLKKFYLFTLHILPQPIGWHTCTILKSDSHWHCATTFAWRVEHARGRCIIFIYTHMHIQKIWNALNFIQIIVTFVTHLWLQINLCLISWMLRILR